MSEEESPEDFPSEPPGPGPSSVPPKEKETRRSRLEGVIPEIIKRAVEIGVEKARESPDNVRQFVQDMKLPKEVAHVIFQQIDDTKNGLFRVVAKEIRDFLEHTNFAGEVQKLLTTVQFEVNTTIRFTPNDGRDPKPKDDEGEDDEDDDGKPSSEKSGKPGPGSDSSASSRQSLPKPEVKTSVRVSRDERPRRGPRSRA